MKNTELKPLSKALSMVEQVSLDVTYAHEDLVFVEHNPFLLRFDTKDASKMYLHFNKECEKDAAAELEQKLIVAAEKEGLDLFLSQQYEMRPNKKEDTIDIYFLN